MHRAQPLTLVSSALDAIKSEGRAKPWRDDTDWPRKAALLSAVVHASELLLSAQSLGDIATDVLRTIGQAMGADRCTLGHWGPPAARHHQGHITFDFEWVGPGIPRQIDTPAQKTLDCGLYPDFMVALHRGEPVAIKTTEMADAAGSAEQAAMLCQSQFVYPIVVDGSLWGLFGADDCHHPRDWSVDEIATLRVVAAAFASVVKRERMSAQRLEAERSKAETASAFNRELTRRNDLLNVVVEASELLLKAQSLDEVIETILARIGTAMAADRCCLGQCASPDAHSRSGYVTFTHEWTAPGIPRQTDTPSLKTFNFDKYQ